MSPKGASVTLILTNDKRVVGFIGGCNGGHEIIEFLNRQQLLAADEK